MSPAPLPDSNPSLVITNVRRVVAKLVARERRRSWMIQIANTQLTENTTSDSAHSSMLPNTMPGSSR